MNRKEKIFAYINSAGYIPLTFDELISVLDVPNEDRDEFSELLSELINEGKIFISKKKRYSSCEKSKLYPCTLRCNIRRKFGFGICADREADIYISIENMGGAIDGDKVLVKIISHSKNRDEGIVTAVLERGNSTVSGVMRDEFTVRPDNLKIYKDIKLTDTMNAKIGERVLVEITDYAPNGSIFGIVTSVLGDSNDLKTLTESIIFEHGIKQQFDEDTLSQAKAVPSEPTDADLCGRSDFTDKIIFTIDGDDARDFDDAVSLEMLKNGNYELGVHIADVTNYVTQGSPLDAEAFNRGTSVYLVDRVIPMLPVELSNGICSLNPRVNRLTLSVIMEIDSSGTVVSHKLLKSIIRSCERMTYNNVAEIFHGNEDLREKYAHIVPTLENMLKLSKILNKRRENRGSINFDFPESHIIAGEDGRPKEIVKLIRNDAHKLIEEFMLAANETIAEFAFWADIPFVYRVHEQPDADKMDSFRKFIANFGLYFKGKEVHPKDLQQILEQIEGTENETLIGTYMLRSLMKAEYRSECMGHFGLAAKYYCHFTSPIRRYPDLIIHRILKDFLDGRDLSVYGNYVIEAAAHSSEQERTAENCERDVDDLFKAAYIADYVGAEFNGKVSGVTSFGMFVTLENNVEGLVRLETIDDDYYEYDDEHRALVGQRKGKTYRVGDSVEIEVAKADLQSRQIDFVLKGMSMHRPTVKRFLHKAPPHKSKNSNKIVFKRKNKRGRK